MKWIYYLMTAMILSLSCIPCCADELKDDAQSTTVKHDKNDEDHKEHTACNPFCVCACMSCVGFFSSQFNDFQFKNNVIATPILCTFYSESIVSEPTRQVWQPPKI